MVSGAGFKLFSSLRFDPLLVPLAINIEAWDEARPSGSPFYMLPYHRDRLLQAAENFRWATAVSRISGPNGLAYLASKLCEVIDVQSSKPLRVKVLLDKDGSITVEATPIQAFVSRDTLFPERLPPPRLEKLGDSPSDKADELWTVLLDLSQTKPSPETTYKTTNRDLYNDARQRANIKTFHETKEVLLVNKDQEIMEGSLTTPYFWRNGTWTTPPISSGGQIGTTRRWALEKGLCIERVITADSLVDGEECWISNGVRGFNLCKLDLATRSAA